MQRFRASSISSKSNKQKPIKQLPQNIKKYLLEDYAFLTEYQLLDSPLNNQLQFLAKIKSTQQLVKFKKKPFKSLQTQNGRIIYQRFQTLHALFQKGIVLADNIFILQQANKQYFYYVIEPYLNSKQENSPFLTLQQYFFENRKELIGNFSAKKNLFIKCKNLLDNLSIYGVSYCGLNTKKIIVDDEDNTFLLPFELQTQIVNKPYERAYYPPQLLRFLQSPSQNTIKPQSLPKWDIWSFGCIVLEIFLYLTPYFLSTSLEKQLQRMQKEIQSIFRDFYNEFIAEKKSKQLMNSTYKSISLSIMSSHDAKQDEQKILNFQMNLFHLDQNKREFSFQPNQSNKQVRTQRQNITSRSKNSTKRLFEKTILHKSKNKFDSIRTSRYQSMKNTVMSLINRITQSSIQTQHFTQLNIFQTKNTARQNKKTTSELFTFQLKLKSLLFNDIIGYHFQDKNNSKKQIKLIVNFNNGQKFQFFVNPSKQDIYINQSQLKLNRKITFKQKKMEFIQDLLEEDIHVNISFGQNFEEQLKQAQVFINLSALTVQNQQGLMIWSKPIRGTYAAQKSSSFMCKIKIQAEIKGKHLETDIKNTKIKVIKNTPPFFLQDNKKITKFFKNYHQQNSVEAEEEQTTSRFQQSHQQKGFQKYKNIERNSSFTEFSSIDFVKLDQIIDDQKKHVIDQNIKQAQFEQRKFDRNEIHSQKENILRQIDFNGDDTKITKNLNQSFKEKNLQEKVKKMLEENKKLPKTTQPIDLTKRLKRLLMK